MIMIKNCWSFTIIFLLSTGALLFAQGVWEKPPAEWTRRDVDKILYESPWVRPCVINGYGCAIGPDSGREIRDLYMVRLLSAAPIQAAYTRWLQLMNPSQGLSPADLNLSNAAARTISQERPDSIVIGVEYKIDNQLRAMVVRRFFETQRTPIMKRNAYVVGGHAGRIELKEYVPPGPDGAATQFIFPRTANGDPLITAKDKELRFETWILGRKIEATWKSKALEYSRKIEY